MLMPLQWCWHEVKSTLPELFHFILLYGSAMAEWNKASENIIDLFFPCFTKVVDQLHKLITIGYHVCCLFVVDNRRVRCQTSLSSACRSAFIKVSKFHFFLISSQLLILYSRSTSSPVAATSSSISWRTSSISASVASRPSELMSLLSLSSAVW